MKRQKNGGPSGAHRRIGPLAVLFTLLLAVLWLPGGCSRPAGEPTPNRAGIGADGTAVDGSGQTNGDGGQATNPEGQASGSSAQTAGEGVPGETAGAEAAEGQPGAGDLEAGQPGAGPAAGDARNTPAGAVAEATPALALAAPGELLDSYRIAASYIITTLLPSGERRIESTQLTGAWRRTDGPFGFDAAFSLTNVSGSRRQVLAVVAVGEAVAIQSEGAWSTVARDASLPYADPDRLLSLPFIARVNQGEDLGQETVAGVDVTHYRLTDPQTFAAAVEDLAPIAPGSVRAVLLEGWVADAGYVVRYLLQAELADAQVLDDSGTVLSGQQEVSASYVLSDLDRVAAIEWPADAQPPNTVSVPGFVPNTFPLPEAARVTPRLGMVEIRTDLPEADVAAFYRVRLQELGWTFDGEQGFYSAEKAGQRLRLTILPDEITGETVVRVFGTGE